MDDRSSYEAFPYPSKFFLQTHPDRLAAAATLYGMRPAPVENCRVLELGCGNGSNLISHAFGLPGSKFVGIDFSEVHIARAQKSAAEINIPNIEFRQMNVMDMTAEDFGPFDYLTAHGLFAWVPDSVRKRVLALCRELLEPNGVGYVSYNAYPGAYAREMVRSMLLFHTQDVEEPMEKVNAAIPFLGMLAKNATEREIHGRILEFELKRHFNHFPADIYHDDLGAFYQPYYFHEFVSLLDENGLQFLSEAEIHASGIQGLGEEAIGFLDSIDDPIQREQYLDFLRGRVFRQTLFCRKEIELERKPKPSVMDKFYLASGLRPVAKIGNISLPKIEKFRSAKGQQIQIDHPLAKAALLHLGEIWGQSIATPKLLSEAQRRVEGAGGKVEDREKQFDIARTILLQIALGSEIVELHIHQPSAQTEPSDRPQVNRLSRWQLRDANNVLTLLNKDLKINDKTSRRLMEMLDGTRTRSDLAAELKPFIERVDDLNEKEKRDLVRDLPGWI